MKRATKSERVPKKMRPRFEEIVAITDRVCREHLNEEYAQLARYATAALCRKRPSPLERGRPEIWACGIVYALGRVNFLFDPTQDPHMSTEELCAAFGVKKSTGSNKAKVVREALGMFPMDPNWCLPSQIDRNILAWMISVNGFIVDARTLPREIQELAYEKGLIPYIPADREGNRD